MTIPRNTLVVKETYNAIAEHFAPMLEVSNSSVAEVEFMDSFLAQLPPDSTIIDIGCGVGKHGRYCASKGHHVTGYDISEEMIKRAKKYNDQCPMELLCVADMCDILHCSNFECLSYSSDIGGRYGKISKEKRATVISLVEEMTNRKLFPSKMSEYVYDETNQEILQKIVDRENKKIRNRISKSLDNLPNIEKVYSPLI